MMARTRRAGPGLLAIAALCVAGLAPVARAQGIDLSPAMVAAGAEGVDRVLNDIRVETSGTTGDTARDADIAAKVRLSIGVSTGDVFNRALAEGAVMRARRMPGVRNISYRLAATYNPDGLILAFVVALEKNYAERPAISGALVDGKGLPTLYRNGSALLQFTLNGGSGLFSDANPWFGDPIAFTRNNPLVRVPALGAQTGARATWMEHSIEYGAAGMTQIGDTPIYAYGAISGLTAASRGRDIFRDDARSTTRIEKGYGGLLYVAPEGDLSVNLSGGRQNFTLNDGFLISQFGSQYNAGPRPGVYLAPRTAHDWAFVGTVKWGQWTLKGFVLDPNEPKTKDLDSKTQVAGVNLRYNFTPTFYGDVSFLNSPRSNTKYPIAGANPTPTRSGVKTYAAHLRWSDRAVLPGVWMEAEGAYQSHQYIPMSAWAGYGTVGYLAAWAPWTPSLSYRYAYFSGDKRDTLPYERFDPLFSGGLNEWLQGISLAKALSQTNSHVQRVRFNLAPTPRLNLTLDVFLRRADVMNNLGGNPALSQLKFKDLGRELTFTTRWAASDNFYILGIASLAKPGEAIRAITNLPAKNWTTLQAQLFWSL